MPDAVPALEVCLREGSAARPEELQVAVAELFKQQLQHGPPAEGQLLQTVAVSGLDAHVRHVRVCDVADGAAGSLQVPTLSAESLWHVCLPRLSAPCVPHVFSAFLSLSSSGCMQPLWARAVVRVRSSMCTSSTTRSPLRRPPREAIRRRSDSA